MSSPRQRWAGSVQVGDTQPPYAAQEPQAASTCHLEKARGTQETVPHPPTHLVLT